MANVTIYLPDEVESKIRSAAQKDQVSVSRWIAARIARLVDDGPPNELLELAGAFPEFPDIEELRSGYGADAPREPIP